jgi:hypothetical protein
MKQGSTYCVFQKENPQKIMLRREEPRSFPVTRSCASPLDLRAASANSLSSPFVTVTPRIATAPRQGRFSFRRTNSDGDVVSSILSGAGTGRRGRHRNHTNDTRSRPCDSIRPPRWRGWRPPPTMPSRWRSTQRSYARSHSRSKAPSTPTRRSMAVTDFTHVWFAPAITIGAPLAVAMRRLDCPTFTRSRICFRRPSRALPTRVSKSRGCIITP